MHGGLKNKTLKSFTFLSQQIILIQDVITISYNTGIYILTQALSKCEKIVELVKS